jgi:CO/xanthine dehydrogenase Mo-binding subunit
MSATTFEAGRFGSGQQVQRVEDPALLAGKGQFTDDVSPAGELQVVFVRSPHAHARIVAIHSAAASSMPGVVAVFTGAQLAQAGVKPLPVVVPFKRAGEHRHHAGHRRRGRAVNGHDACMRVRRAHEHHVQLAGRRHVVGELPLAGEQRRVFDTLHLLAAAEAAGIDGRNSAHFVPSARSSLAASCTDATMLT